MNAVDRWTDPETPKAVQEKIAQATADPIDVEIEGFTADDFATERPYIYILMHHRDSEPVLQGLRIKLKKQAERCKIKARDFDSMCKATFTAHSDLLPRNAAPSTNACEYEGLERFGINAADIKCAGYRMSMTGVGTTANIKGMEIPIRVCSHPILITKRYTNVLSNYETVDISFFRDGHWKTLRQMPLSDVYSTTKIVALLASRGVSVTSETAKVLVTFLQETYDANRDDIISVKTTDSIGWQLDGTFAPYTSDTEIDAGGDTGDLAAIAAALRTEGDPDVWVNGVNAIRANRVRSTPIRMMMASSFASPLLEKLSCLPYWTHMVGNGSTGKTVTMRLCATVWGYAPLAGGLMKTMNNTTCAIEEMARFSRNVPLLLNELQTIQDQKDFSLRIYNFCEGQGRGRMRRAGGLRDIARWFNNALSCGEQSITTSVDHGGAISRVIEIPVREKLFDDPQSFCTEVLDKSFGHAGKMFIEGLSTEDYNALKAEIVDTAHRLELYGKNEKQTDAAAVMLLADRLAEKYVFHDGVRLTENDLLPFLKDKIEIDDNVRALDWLRGFIVANSHCFVSKDNPEPRGEKYGKVEINGDAVTVYFLQTQFNELIKNAGFDSRRFVLWAIEQGIAEDGRRYGNGRDLARLKKGVVTPGVATRAYVFTMNDKDEELTPDEQKKADQQKEDISHGFTPVQEEIPF